MRATKVEEQQPKAKTMTTTVPTTNMEAQTKASKMMSQRENDINMPPPSI
jgi:hypothetical protein